MTDTPTPIMAAVVFTEGGGFELRPLQGCTAEDVATLARISLVPWFLGVRARRSRVIRIHESSSGGIDLAMPG
jgi:hypothetical protein